MNLDETVRRKIADWQPPDTGRHVLAIPGAGTGWAVTVAADRCDDLGCLVWELSVRRTTSLAAVRSGALQAWADHSAARVTGLLEPLKVVEVDVLRNEALLRSNEPAQRDNQLFYYEVFLKGIHEAVVRRYQAPRQADGRRQQVAFALTREAIVKLAADLAAEE